MRLCLAEVRILDYSNAQLVTIERGTAKLQTGTFRIIHEIDIDKYNYILEDIESRAHMEELSKNPNYPFISLLISQIRIHLSNLKIESRSKRSLNFIGSAWKWIAGNPDHEDHEIVVNKLNNALENNNNQILINKLTIERINEITNITNHITKELQNDKNKGVEAFLRLKYKLEILKEEIVNIAYAIHWAKANIINSYIMSREEIDIAKQIFEKDDIPFVNLDEALEFSEVKVATNSKLIIYIINLPTVGPQICKSIDIRAVKKNNTINKINFNSLLDCEKTLYGILKPCKNTIRSKYVLEVVY